MIAVFLDTVGLIALWDRSDQWHKDALAAFQLLAERNTLLVTSSFILLETGNAAARRPYRPAVDNLRVELEATQSLVVPSEEDWNVGWREFRKGSANNAGIVDQVSFAIMKRLGLRQSFTNDSHFRSAGFETLF